MLDSTAAFAETCSVGNDSGITVNELPEQITISAFGGCYPGDMAFLRAMQGCHDLPIIGSTLNLSTLDDNFNKEYMESFEGHMSDLAKRYGLQYTPPQDAEDTSRIF